MYRRIVVGTDCSTTADIAVGKAAEIAKSMGATLHVVSAFSEPGGAVMAASATAGVAPAEWQVSPIAQRDAQIEALGARLRSQGIDVTTSVVVGDPADALIAEAERTDADLLVVGDRGLKGIRGLLGSVPNRVTHKASLDVVVVHTT
ncbi:MAG: universal stress protein [Acidimicrobiales bacterium]